MADRVGFEPTIPVKVLRISSAVPSTARPPVRLADQILKPGPDGKPGRKACATPRSYSLAQMAHIEDLPRCALAIRNRDIGARIHVHRFFLPAERVGQRPPRFA